MTATVLSGKPLAKLIQQKAQKEAKALAEEGVRPTLAVVVATEDSSTHWYVRSIERATEHAGIDCRVIDLGPDATEQVLISVLKDISAEPSVNGIILQTPLPAGVRSQELVRHIAPEKDIDGANPLSLGLLAVGQRAFAPATARAVIEILDHFDVPLTGRSVVVVGRSAVVGKPLSLLLLQKDATTTVCHSRSGPLAKYTKTADIVVVAAGRTGLLTGADVADHSVVIDVGTNVLSDGSLVGDVDEASVQAVAAALTPVPGGVGSVTTSLLLLHTAEAAREQSRAARLPVLT
ncbi:bifunctional 5,10-methylenetetrahydrofolate dehydrogenase/5,10-methenyltetrahydrofolate cyclohydrolase [Arthrobacter pascens]|jgi:methylenetetrahydrofolate dehydrogenase (NADP+)/methenyltetrahydrofolate cyclohydrolase|uniref:bifunctional 5,10-methylenetetrahydrofolate dehydrogenase/5,10-methenyltetrahydrofolate cyclohydrolase n=1 Tax=Arthrobacter pascens TaxID=1677 RepID=UPI00196AA8DC|nr:bifunctional 5,10-methylenetetrahydrofolate dehydrogenase/5,10-methenyltetrahydrofolate cyclohydrolase [Arthrobacter pascens]MBN3496132.1 bifunctional 5,10-methylenetetrahydrofolate dehydrogenase/5,10-methenyltetrahydrofolate cyclohydrolase [Arthrobacter pascens]MDR6559857.1 methylenetetrahydrofolate dehydrogenase (NADP+)/methenyltetrahydrofolate cyclohydrolase [Arthrobacter pascens]